MKTGKFFWALIAGVTLLAAGKAQADIAITASADKTQVALNDSVRVLVTVSGNAANMPAPQLPDLSAFSVYSSGRAQNVSFVNGQVNSSVNTTYMLSPKSLGKFTIGPFSATADGKTVQTEPISIEVVASAPTTGGAPAPSSAQTQAQHPGSAKAPGAFVKMSLNKSKAMVNEEVILAFRFYHRIQLIANPSYQPPDTTGFAVEDLPPPRNFVESVNGVQYRVTEVKTALFPTKAGTLTLSPAVLNIQVQDLSGDPFSSDFFDQFFRGGGREYALKSDPAKLTVVPFPPEGKPAQFSGGVGEFAMSLSLDKRKAAVGDPVTLTLTLSGKGNIKSLGDPDFPEFAGFRKYDTASSLNIDKAQGRVEGSKVYKIILVPQNSGPQTIPPITFSYFHLGERKYKTLATQSLTVDVAPGQGGGVMITPSSMPAGQIKNVSQEIRYIRQSLKSTKPFAWFHESRAFLLLNLLPLLGILAGILHRLRLAAIARNPRRRRMENAHKKWADALKRIEAGPEEEKAGDAFRAFQNFFADKMLADGAVSVKSVEEFLRKNAADPSVAERVRALWSDFEVAQYAPAQFRSQDARRLIGEAKKLALEANAAIKKSGGAAGAAIKAIAIAVPLIAAAPLLFSQASPQRFEEANRLYQEGQIEAAKNIYEEIARELPAFETKYNLGNAYYRMNWNGKAVAQWLGAFRMNPRDADLRHNLNLACAVTGEPFYPDFFLAKAGSYLKNILNLNELSVLYLVILWAVCAQWTFLLFNSAPLLRSKNIAGLLALLAVFAWWFARYDQEHLKTWGVITRQNAEVRSGPGAQFRAGYTVPEGQRVLILDDRSQSPWTEIGIPRAGIRGWIEQGSCEKI